MGCNGEIKRKISILILVILILTFLPSCVENTGNKGDKKESTGSCSEASDSDGITERTSKWTETGDKNVKMEIINLDISESITWPDIYGDYAVFANYSDNTAERRRIHLFNIITKKDEIIYSAKDAERDSMIEDTRIGSGWVFWAEGHWTTEETKQDWAIKAYNIKNKKIKTIRKVSELPGESTLEPRIENEDNTIVWLEGYLEKDGSLKHVIYSYNADSDTMTKIADVSHVENPYNVTKIRNNTVCFADYINNRCVIRIIDLNTMAETDVPVDEYPEDLCCDGQIVAWKQNLKEPWYMDLNTKVKERVTEIDPFLVDIHAGSIFTSVREDDYRRHIYKCDVANKSIVCLTKSSEKDYDEIYFNFTNFYGDKMVCIFERALQPKGVKYDLVIVEGI